MRLFALAIAVLAILSACSSQVAAIHGTPTADAVLANARRVARQLDSYRAVRSTIERTHYPQRPALDFTESRQQEIEVASAESYRIASAAFEFEQIRLNQTFYFRSESGAWQASAVTPAEEWEMLPGETSPMPPAHPWEWLDSRYVVDTVYTGQDEINGIAVYVINGMIPMLPAPAANDDPGIPSDNVTLYIDTKSFQVLRIEIDQNILDSMREDSGYQIIPGVVEIETREVIDYSDHNAEIEIKPPTDPTTI